MSTDSNSNLLSSFRNEIEKSKHLVIMTGAGVSAESGIPTFRGEGGLWRSFNAQELATPQAFRKNPSLVWQFYQYRRNIVMEKKPNNGHYAIAEIEKRFLQEGKKFCLITQNVDGYHLLAGSKNVIQMHGNLMETRCTKCLHVEANNEILVDCDESAKISVDDLPKCKKGNCNGLLRPNVVWFNETLKSSDMAKIHEELNACDFFIIVGTSGVVYPAAGFGEIVANRKAPIAEFNIESSATCEHTKYYVRGKSGELLPKFLLGQ